MCQDIMKILSIDVGIKNLALCTFDDVTCNILKWDVIALRPVRDDLARAVKLGLDAYPLECLDRVVIEQQPGRNRRMKTVENFIHMYFVCNHTAPVVSFHARAKLSGTGLENRGNSAAQYRARKKASVLMCQQWLQCSAQNACWLSIFDAKGTKKDDLADSLNQVLAYCRMTPVATQETLDIQATAVRARKPTEKQIKKGNYSKSNLKHFVNKLPTRESAMEEIRSDPKQMRAAVKHYGTVGCCVENLHDSCAEIRAIPSNAPALLC